MPAAGQVRNTGMTSLPEHQGSVQVHQAESESSGVHQATSSDSGADRKSDAGGSAAHDDIDEEIDSAEVTGAGRSTRSEADNTESEKGAEPPEKQKTEDNPSNDSADTKGGEATAENEQSGEELIPLDLTPKPGNGEDVPLMDLRSNGAPDVSGDTVGEAEEGSVILEITNPVDRNVDDSNHDGSVVGSTGPSKQSQDAKASGDVSGSSKMEAGKEKGSLVKRQGNSTRVGSAASTRTRPKSGGISGQTPVRLQSKDVSRTFTAASVRTQRGTAAATRFGSSRQSKENSPQDSFSKSARSFPSSASRFSRNTEPNTARSLMERNLKKTERTASKTNEKPQVHQSVALSSSSTPVKKNENKDVKQESDDTSQTQTTGLPDSKPNQTADTQSRTQPTTNPLTPIKTANGVAPNIGRKKTSETQVTAGSGKKDVDSPGGKVARKEKKPLPLLNRSVLKRVASTESKPNHAFKSQPKSSDLNSSGGSNTSADRKSISSDCSSDRPQLMQSLSVPSTTLGPAPAEVDERSSLESSTKNSARLSLDSRKSLDYRVSSMGQHHVPMPGMGEDKPRSVLMMHDDTVIRAAIPFMPVRLAVLCLVLNILLPGAGTVISGFSVACCGGTSRVSSKKDSKGMTICLNLLVGVTQLATVVFLMVGWFWSLAWGIKMVILAVEHRTEKRQQREKELQTLALSAFSSTPGNLRRSLLPPV